jgi:hypothetical protein
MEAVNSSEMSLSFYKTKWCHAAEYSTLDGRHCENLKSNVVEAYIWIFMV